MGLRINVLVSSARAAGLAVKEGECEEGERGGSCSRPRCEGRGE